VKPHLSGLPLELEAPDGFDRPELLREPEARPKAEHEAPLRVALSMSERIKVELGEPKT
jgi:hypothetical protein